LKLKLRTSGDIQILTVSELDNPKNVEILRAGIKKTLLMGKNRIVLELTEPALIPADALRELAHLKLLANELSGDIVLAGLNEQERIKVQSFSKPTPAACFQTTQQALDYLTTPAKPAAAPAPPSVATPTAPATTLQNAQPAVLPGQKEALKEDVRKNELGDLGKLRKEVERLKAENTSLLELLSTQIFERREPGDVKAYQEKIVVLEAQLADVFDKPPEKKA
jgi:hypothetical protein